MNERAAISRFYIILEERHGNQTGISLGWRVMSGPYFSRMAAEAFLRNYAGGNMMPKVVSRLWLEQAYPLNEWGEERLQKVLDLRREAEEAR